MTPGQLKQIVDAAEAAWPAECCGLLVGRSRGRDIHVAEVAPSDNVAASGHDRFEVDPALRLGLEKRLRGGRDRVVGLYHSHPNGSAMPSATDLGSIWEPDLIWLITGVLDGQAVHTTAHRPRADGAAFRQIRLRTHAWDSSRET